MVKELYKLRLHYDKTFFIEHFRIYRKSWERKSVLVTGEWLVDHE